MSPESGPQLTGYQPARTTPTIVGTRQTATNAMTPRMTHMSHHGYPSTSAAPGAACCGFWAFAVPEEIVPTADQTGEQLQLA